MVYRVIAVLLSVMLVASIFAGCSSAGPKDNPPPPQGAMSTENWWDNPGEFTDALYGVGVAPMKSRLAEQNARSSAYANGQQQIAAGLRARIQSLVSTWSKSTGDAADEATIQELFNNEQFNRQIVDNVLQGARAVKYAVSPVLPGNVYCLVALDAEKYTNAVKQSAGDTLKKQRTEVMTQIRKDECEAKLDELLDKEQKQIEKQEAAVLNARGLKAPVR